MKTKQINDVLGPVRQFATQAAWLAWLDKNQRSSQGLWLRLGKKRSGLKKVNYA